MDISLRMWLLIILSVLILGILIDGIRRWRQHQRNPYRLSLGSIHVDETDDPFRHVFPSGGPRPVDPAKLETGKKEPPVEPEILPEENNAAESIEPIKAESFFARHAKSKPKVDDVEKTIKVKKAKQEQLDFTESVPVLMDPVFSNENDEVFDTDEVTEEADVLDNAKPLTTNTSKTVEEEPEVEEAIVLNVFSKDAAGFQGEPLLAVLLNTGLRYGDMSIFHRHQSPTGEGKVLFSVANAMKPGTFKIEAMNKFSTKGLSFFFGLPGPNNPIEAFDLMLETAQYLCKQLNGELKDDKRSVLTVQTIEHYRARIRDFERRYLAQ